MGKHEFERIDEVLDHLTEEMDISLRDIERCKNNRLDEINNRRTSSKTCQNEGESWIKAKDFSDLFDRMNGRFEHLAKRLRH